MGRGRGGYRCFWLLNVVIEAEKGEISINDDKFELNGMQIFGGAQLSLSSQKPGPAL